MDLTPINQAIEAAYQAALADPQRVTPQEIAPNVTLQTDLYTAPSGNGFRVVCRIKVPEANFIAVRVRNHGPDTGSEREWPSEGIEAAAQAHVSSCMARAQEYLIKHGFGADEKVILLNKLMQSQQANQTLPKLSALYTWFDAIQTTALQGKTMFDNPPYSFKEVMMESPAI